jgi:hypothetical protein
LVALKVEPTVVEPVVSRVLREARPETESEVEVALVVVPFTTLSPKMDEEAVLTMMLSVVVGVRAPFNICQSWKVVVCATVAKSEPATAAMSAPPVVALRREPLPMEEMAKEVVVAAVVVLVSTLSAVIDEEALMMMPTVVVGERAPLTSSKVLPNPAPEPEHDWVERSPVALTVTQVPAPLPKAETMRLVVEASPATSREVEVAAVVVAKSPVKF